MHKQQSVSHVLYRCTQADASLYSGGNYLSVELNSTSHMRSFPLQECPYQIWVSHSWGLPVPRLSFPIDIVTVALLKVLIPYLSTQVCSQPSTNHISCPNLLFRQARTLQSSQTVRAWTFLYIIKIMQRLSKNYYSSFLIP